MISTIISTLAIIFYSLGTGLQKRNLTSDSPQRSGVFVSGLIAVVFHLSAILLTTIQAEGYNFGFFNVGSIISWVVAVLVLFSSLRKPLDNLFLFLFPLSIICILTAAVFPGQSVSNLNYSTGVAVHILLGILSFSIITIATFQSILLSFLNRLLKTKKSFALVSHLPPLETMEALLFEIVWVGWIALSGVIVTGVLFMEDFLGQHLSHKTVFSIISWILFSILLWGRHQLGWRGKTASRWIISGFIFLVLAYFGSKFVLEFILHRV